MLRARRSYPALQMLTTPLRRCIMNGCGSFNDGLQAHALASASASQGTGTSAFSERLSHSLIVPAGSAHGMFALAQMMRLGICGVQRDVAAAAQQYAAAAQLQHAAACSNLGAMREHGLGVSQNLHEALRLYDLAASLGNSVAHDNSAVLQRKMQDPQSTFPVAVPASVESAPVPVAADSKYAPTEDEALLLRSTTRAKYFISCALRSNSLSRSVAFGHENEVLADVRHALRSSMDVHYLNAIASRAISGRGRSFKGHSIENYAVKALLLDGSDFSGSKLSNVTISRSSLSDCSFSSATLKVPPAYTAPSPKPLIILPTQITSIPNNPA
jgi:hypothetical protein